MPYSLKDRRVLVTGGSRGLGALICEKFAVEGAHVMVNYVSNKDKADRVVYKARSYGVNDFAIQGVNKHQNKLLLEEINNLNSSDDRNRTQVFQMTTHALWKKPSNS